MCNDKLYHPDGGIRKLNQAAVKLVRRHGSLPADKAAVMVAGDRSVKRVGRSPKHRTEMAARSLDGLIEAGVLMMSPDFEAGHNFPGGANKKTPRPQRMTRPVASATNPAHSSALDNTVFLDPANSAG